MSVNILQMKFHENMNILSEDTDNNHAPEMLSKTGYRRGVGELKIPRVLGEKLHRKCDEIIARGLGRI